MLTSSPDDILVAVALSGLAMVAGLTSLMLWGFRRRYKYAFPAYWALGWLAAAIHYSLQTAAYHAAGSPPSSLFRIALTWASQTTGYWQSAMFVFAVVSMVLNRDALALRVKRWLLVAVPIATLGLTLMFAFDPGANGGRYFVRIVVPGAIIGVSFLTTAILAARRIATAAPVAHRALVWSLVGLGFVELLHAAPWFWSLFTGVLPTFGPFLGLLELGFTLALSMAMTAWFLERDRTAAVEHHDRLQEATAALQQRDEQFQAILQYAPYGIILKDLEGRYLMANDAAAQILGLPNKDVLQGRRTSDLFSAEVATLLRSADGTAIELGECESEFDHVGADGVARIINTQRFPIRNERGEAVGVCITTSDVTDRRQGEAQYHQSQKLESIGRLAGGVAHDFNNLLTAILAHVEFAEQSEQLEVEVREDLGQIRVAAERAAGLTGQLLAFARRQVVEPQIIDLSKHVTGMGHMLRRLIGETIESGIDVTAEPWLVRADPGHIEQAIVNLVLNARDAMPEGGRLTIRTENVEVYDHSSLTHRGLTPGDYHTLQVSDTGTGMTEEVKSRIFEPFFSTKPAGRGTGLGLATVYGIVAQSGGHILVDSAQGRGTTFAIYLPRVTGSQPVALPAPVPSQLHDGTGETVLVVEDESDVRDVVARTLSGAGYRVLTADNGEAAILCANAQDSHIDVLVTDVVMPRIGGVDLVRQLSVSRPDMRVVLTSGYSGESLGIARFIGERNDVLAKPFTPADLLRRVGQVLESDAADAPTAARVTREFSAFTGLD